MVESLSQLSKKNDKKDELEQRTSFVEFISSIHGEQRRMERNISRRDLQAAVKYGKKKRTYKGYSYTYADVVYITDKSSTKEITSWALQLPLEKFELDASEQQQNEV